MNKRVDAESVQKINEEVLATVARAREALERKREWEAATGRTRESNQKDYEQLSQPARTWVNSLLNAAMKRAQPEAGAPVRKARRTRTMV